MDQGTSGIDYLPGAGGAGVDLLDALAFCISSNRCLRNCSACSFGGATGLDSVGADPQPITEKNRKAETTAAHNAVNFFTG